MNAPIEGHDLLTHSRIECYGTCPRKHQWQYELGIRRERISQPLRFGSGFHLGLDLLAQGKTLAKVLDVIAEAYAIIPEWVDDPSDWITEHETLVRLLCGYVWYWEGCDGGLFGGEVIETEQSFELPILGPHGRPTPTYRLAGKRDKIIRLVDARAAVMEHKTTSQSIAAGADYWLRLRIDHQISLYMHTARAAGQDVQTVVYDAIHKPGMGRKAIPLLDENDFKIVLDTNGERVFLTKPKGKPRQSVDKAGAGLGWVLQTRPENPGEFGERLNDDIAARPEFYYRREEVPRLESDLDEFRAELWDTQKMIRFCQLKNRWPRRTSACLSPFRCEYFGLCTEGVEPNGQVPNGFVQLTHVHPELEIDHAATDSTIGAADNGRAVEETASTAVGAE